MVRRARVRLEQEHTTPSLLRDLTFGNLSRLTPKMIQAAARAGDTVAKTIIDDTGFFLGVWLAGMITLLDPEGIGIGGGPAPIAEPPSAKITCTPPPFTISSPSA